MLNWFSSACIGQAMHAISLYVDTLISVNRTHDISICDAAEPPRHIYSNHDLTVTFFLHRWRLD